MDLYRLDREIADIARLLDLARENEFRELARAIERDIATGMLPVVALMLTMVDGNNRPELAARYQRLAGLLPDRVIDNLLPHGAGEL